MSDEENEDQIELGEESEDESELEEIEEEIIEEEPINKVEIEDRIIITDPSHWVTPPFITQFEFARVLAERTAQIEKDSLTMLGDDEIRYLKPDEIAMKELQKGCCPMSILRPISYKKSGPVTYEKRNVNELIGLAPPEALRTYKSSTE